MATITQHLIKQANDGIARARESKQRIRRNSKKTRVLGKLVDAHNKTGGMAYASADCYGGDINVSIILRGLDGFFDPRLVNALSRVMDLGVDLRSSDYPDNLERTYSGEIELEPGFNARISVYATVRSDSPTCRKVPVGTEQVTVTKYRIECDGVAAA